MRVSSFYINLRGLKMGENCKDCPYYFAVLERLAKLEAAQIKINDAITEIKTAAAAEKERLDSTFKILKEIKDSIEKISNQITAIQLKPAAKWENIGYEIVKYAVLLGLGLLIGKNT